jgi:hypothetical protein
MSASYLVNHYSKMLMKIIEEYIWMHICEWIDQWIYIWMYIWMDGCIASDMILYLIKLSVLPVAYLQQPACRHA